MDSGAFGDTVVHVVAALIGMIPEGLVLLTSTVLAISVIRLAKYNVLVQELYCIETLARVDTICLDKTGTITKGEMEVSKIVPINGCSMNEIVDALSMMSYHMDNDNQTMKRLATKYARRNDHKVIEIVPFSSQAKWSGISFEDVSYVLGAPEIILKDTSKIDRELSRYVNSNRVVLLGKVYHKLNKMLPSDLVPMGLVIINDKIRLEARATLEYFKEQGVDINLFLVIIQKRWLVLRKRLVF